MGKIKKRGLIITGTDTGAGKTFVAGGIAAALSILGYRVGVMKPVETGCAGRAGRLIPADALFLRKMADSSAPPDLVNPYRFRAALAPLHAARMEKRKIDPGKILDSLQMLLSMNDFVIVEGAGGVAVPVTEELMMLGLFARMDLPVMLVAGIRLGAINHAILSEMPIRMAGLRYRALCLNHLRGTPEDVLSSSVHTLMKRSHAEEIFEIGTFRKKPGKIQRETLAAFFIESIGEKRLLGLI